MLENRLYQLRRRLEFARVLENSIELRGQEEFENISKLTRSAATEVASGERLRKFHETSRYRKNMKILENSLYQHQRGEKLTRDSENFIELRGRERI